MYRYVCIAKLRKNECIACKKDLLFCVQGRVRVTSTKSELRKNECIACKKNLLFCVQGRVRVTSTKSDYLKVRLERRDLGFKPIPFDAYRIEKLFPVVNISNSGKCINNLSVRIS